MKACFLGRSFCGRVAAVYRIVPDLPVGAGQVSHEKTREWEKMKDI